MNIKEINQKTRQEPLVDDHSMLDNTVSELTELWKGALEGTSDIFDVLLRLLSFFSSAPESHTSALCKINSFAELWKIITEGESDSLKDVALRLLCQIVQYGNEELAFLQEETSVGVLFDLLMSLDSDICQDSLFLLCALIDANESIASMLIEAGLMDRMILISANDAFGLMLLSLSRVPGEHFGKVIELLGFCMHSSELNIKNALSAVGNMLSYADENEDTELAEALLQFLVANIQIISEQKDPSVVKKIMYILDMYNELDPSFASVVLSLIRNSLNNEDDYKNHGLYYGCNLFLKFSETWGGSVEEDLFPLIIEAYELVNYSCRKNIAKVLLKYFPFAEQMSKEVASIFGDSMDDTEIGADCMIAFSAMLQKFHKDPDMSELLLRYIDKVYEATTSETDALIEAAETFISVFRDIQNQ